MTQLFGAILLTGSLLLFSSGIASADVSCETDFNGDGVSDQADYEILKALIGSNEDLEGYSAIVDLNGDGQIDLDDFSIFTNCN